ncbi:hypothetical protein [Actinomyces wuliandei]|uniref:hypothetical protein n=1 Tax=Actinomyces wuliandei TaxID=2057743 RepID=UPI001FAB1625|nr:hypothetical protein [Actinomyces wuliandei]
MTQSAFSLLNNGRSLAGSQFAGIAQTQEMLDFCADHDVAATVEAIAASGINEAFARVLASDVRYRFVVDTATVTG